jgi:hypothetical protein
MSEPIEFDRIERAETILPPCSDAQNTEWRHRFLAGDSVAELAREFCAKTGRPYTLEGAIKMYRFCRTTLAALGEDTRFSDADEAELKRLFLETRNSR